MFIVFMFISIHIKYKTSVFFNINYFINENLLNSNLKYMFVYLFAMIGILITLFFIFRNNKLN